MDVIRGAEITVCTPHIPPRKTEIMRCVNSVSAQTYPAFAHIITTDVYKEGAAKTRQRALDAVSTPWVAFLDDDDMFMPNHLEDLIKFALDWNYDFVYSWFKIMKGGIVYENDPVFPPGHYLDPWDPENPRHTTVTTLVKTDLAKEAEFIMPDEGGIYEDGMRSNEDWGFIERCNKMGTIGHLVQKTWYWCHDKNTSGLPSRW